MPRCANEMISAELSLPIAGSPTLQCTIESWAIRHMNDCQPVWSTVYQIPNRRRIAWFTEGNLTEWDGTSKSADLPKNFAPTYKSERAKSFWTRCVFEAREEVVK